MENVFSINGGGKPNKGSREVALTGEVIYESIHRSINKAALRQFIHAAIERRLAEVEGSLLWASYLVIFSPGQDYEEVRCQVDVETDGDRAAFSIGYGQRPNHAFNDAIERMQWYEKNVPLQISI